MPHMCLTATKLPLATTSGIRVRNPDILTAQEVRPVLFWPIAIAFCLITACILLIPILRGQPKQDDTRLSDIAVYKDQLKELDADRDRGLIGEAEAQTARAEIGRRLIAVADVADNQGQPAPRNASVGLGIGLLLAFLVGGTSLYTYLGAPGTPDQPLAARNDQRTNLSQADAEARVVEAMAADRVAATPEDAALIAQLEAALADKPDARGFGILSSTRSSLRQFPEAIAAQEARLALLGEDAVANDFATYAELLIFAARGYVSQEADRALGQALQNDLTDTRARYYTGVSLAQNGRPDGALQIWARLLSEGPPDAPWKAPIAEQMRDLAQRTGLPLPGDMPRGPTAEDIEAAEDMSAEDRLEMIKGMVNSLETRLATQGGAPQDWARLVRALIVLEQNDRAAVILGEAREAFAGQDDAQSLFDTVEAALP